MPEYRAAEIWIGGLIRQQLIPQLCAAISAERASLEWGDVRFRPRSAEALLAAVLEQDGTDLLYLCDDQASEGEFSGLEAFLCSAGVPFSRRTEGKCEFEPERIEFRPGLPRLRLVTNVKGKPTIEVAVLRDVTSQLEQLEQIAAGESQAFVRVGLREVRQTLESILPPTVLPLPAFTIQA